MTSSRSSKPSEHNSLHRTSRSHNYCDMFQTCNPCTQSTFVIIMFYVASCYVCIHPCHNARDHLCSMGLDTASYKDGKTFPTRCTHMMKTSMRTHMNTNTHNEMYECFAPSGTKIASSTRRTHMKMKKRNDIYDMKIQPKINHEGGDRDNPSIPMN